MTDSLLNLRRLVAGDQRPQQPRAGRGDPFAGFNFSVEIEGLLAGGFAEVTGLSAQIEVQPYREGGGNSYAHQLPGPASYGNLTLRRGLTDADLFWGWLQDVAEGAIVRRNLTVALLSTGGEPLMLWDIRRAFPVRWAGPDLRAAGAELAFETVELAHHGIRRSKGLSRIAAEAIDDAVKRWL
mgnify:CR=1 FL=1